MNKKEPGCGLCRPPNMGVTMRFSESAPLCSMHAEQVKRVLELDGLSKMGIEVDVNSVAASSVSASDVEQSELTWMRSVTHKNEHLKAHLTKLAARMGYAAEQLRHAPNDEPVFGTYVNAVASLAEDIIRSIKPHYRSEQAEASRKCSMCWPPWTRTRDAGSLEETAVLGVSLCNEHYEEAQHGDMASRLFAHYAAIAGEDAHGQR